MKCLWCEEDVESHNESLLLHDECIQLVRDHLTMVPYRKRPGHQCIYVEADPRYHKCMICGRVRDA